MNLIEISLTDKMHPSELKHLRDISSGSYGKVIETVHKPSGRVFAMKILEISEESPEILIRTEINFLLDLSKLPQKPAIFPNFYGFFLTFDETSGKKTFFLLFDLKKRNLNELILEKTPISFEIFENSLMKMINGLAYLQTLSICHRDLKPQNILIENRDSSLELTLIDFGISKRVVEKNAEFTQEMTIIGTENYFSPELRQNLGFSQKTQINPYKSDVFSLGLVMLKMKAHRLPNANRDFCDEIQGLLTEISAKFVEEANNEKNTLRRIEKVVMILKEMLEISAKNRPDFIELFYKTLKIEENPEKIQEMILLRDGGFFLSKNKANANADANANAEAEAEEIKEEFKERFPREARKSSIVSRIYAEKDAEIHKALFEKIEAFLQEKKAEIPPLNMVISGEMLERSRFMNKILGFFGLKDDLFEIPEDFLEISPFIIEIQGNCDAFTSETSVNSIKKNSEKTDNFRDFRKILTQQFSQHSILHLKSSEKPFIYHKILLKLPIFRANFLMISSGFENPAFLEKMKEALDRKPCVFVAVKNLEIRKYDPNFLRFFYKLQRKTQAEYWTVFRNEEAFVEKYRVQDKDNEKSLISKKYQKILDFEKILKLEEEFLEFLPSRKRVFFLQNNEIFTNFFIKSLDFLHRSLCESWLFRMCESSKKIEKNEIFAENRRFSAEKIREIRENSAFFFSEFSSQIEVFFEKLHQGALENMRKNVDFFPALETLIFRGVSFVKNTQDFFSKKNFVKEVLCVIQGDLQSFFLSKIYGLLFPFLKILLVKSMEELGSEEMTRFFQWRLEENKEDNEDLSQIEKILLGILMRKTLEYKGKISEKLLLKTKETLKFFRFEEAHFNQISTNIGFWSYEGAKNDILKMVLINIRENKVENIRKINEILQMIANEYFARLEEFPQEVQEEKGEGDLLLQKEVLKAVELFRKRKDGLFSAENLGELQDENLKEVLQVKINKGFMQK